MSLVACDGATPSLFKTNHLTWEERTGYSNLGLGRHHPIMFANETHGFLMMGTTATSLGTSDLLIYEASTDQWTESLMDATTGPRARSFGYGVVLPIAHHPKAYVGFGAAADSGERLSDFWEFDMRTHTWTPLANFPGLARRHPAMNAVFSSSSWQIQVGLGDGITADGRFSNLDDWWSYDISLNTWTRLDDFPSTPRHHPFHFALQQISYVGLGHSSFGIERDFYGYHNTNKNTEQPWQRESNFASYDNADVIVTTEARVAGTQFSIELPLSTTTVADASTEKDVNLFSSVLSGALGFVLSGDGSDHGPMATGEFHVFDPSSKPSSGTETGRWQSLPPHPGRSRWAPGSFVIRGTAHVYFSSGYDRFDRLLFADLWTMDLSSLFLSNDDDSNNNNATFSHPTTPPSSPTSAPLPSRIENAPSTSSAAALTAVNPTRRSLFLVATVVSSIAPWILYL
jgi:hypothetical protein